MYSLRCIRFMFHELGDTLTQSHLWSTQLCLGVHPTPSPFTFQVCCIVIIYVLGTNDCACTFWTLQSPIYSHSHQLCLLSCWPLGSWLQANTSLIYLRVAPFQDHCRALCPQQGKELVRFTVSEILDRCGNDPSAGSPTETLLRLHLPLSDKV